MVLQRCASYWVRFAFALLVSDVIALAAESKSGDGWTDHVVTSDSVTLTARKPAGCTLHELRASCVVNARPERVFEIALRRDSYDNSTKHVKDYRVMAKEGEDVWYTYERLDFPVISDRDYTLRYESLRDTAKRHFRIRWTLANERGPGPVKGVIRVSATHGSLEMIPEGDGTHTLLVCTMYADPGGWIPTWLIESVNRKTVPDLMRQLRTKAQKKEEKKTAEGPPLIASPSRCSAQASRGQSRQPVWRGEGSQTESNNPIFSDFAPLQRSGLSRD